MAVYHIESITIRDKSVVPVRVQWPATIAYQSTDEVLGDQNVVNYDGEVLGTDQTGYFLRMRMADGTTTQLRNSDIVSVFQEQEVEAGSTIYWGNTATPPANLGKVTDVYISKNGDCYSLTETGWRLQTNLRGPVGAKGDKPMLTIGTNGNWYIDGVDSGTSAKGINGKDGASPVIDPTTKHWMLKGVDLGVCAEGQVPYIGANGNWWINSTDTGVLASGVTLMPVIDPTSKHWFIDGTDTGVLAEGKDGGTPTIDPASKHWFVNGVDTGIIAEGVGLPVNLTINTTTLNWEIDGVDTGVPATGPQGVPGKDGKDGDSFQLYAVYKDETEMDTAESTIPENSFVALITTTDVMLFVKKSGYIPDLTEHPNDRNSFVWIKNLTDAIQIEGAPGKDGQTPWIDGTTKHWMIGTTDTGVSAEPLIPYVGPNGNWFVGMTDTGEKATGDDGTSPHIDPTTKHWMVGTFDTGVLAEATLPSIDPTTKNWIVNGTDTGISAKGSDGLTPYIGGNGNWFIGATDSGVSASGVCPTVNSTTGNWEVSGVDTGVPATGPAGKSPTITIDITTKNWLIDGKDTGVKSIGMDGNTPTIGANGNWWIDGTDTGVVAKGDSGITPHIDPTSKHWMIGTTDTGIVAEGKVDEKDLQILKNRLNFLTSAKTSLKNKPGYLHIYETRTTGTVGQDCANVKTGVNLLTAMSTFSSFETNMAFDDNDYLKLAAGKRYRLSTNIFIRGINAEIGWRKKDSTIISPKSYGTRITDGDPLPSTETIIFSYAPTEDTYIGLFVTNSYPAGSTGLLIGRYSSVLVEEIDDFREVDPIEYIRQDEGIEDNPIGTIIPYMGNTPPKHYLACDGAILNIDDYPDLASHFVEEFGAAEHFGGDGLTTFAVPDLRGEFLRGSGTADRDTGSGADVGTHQDATEHPTLTTTDSGAYIAAIYGGSAANKPVPINQDTIAVKATNMISHTATKEPFSSNTLGARYTSRPTNTAVLYCIKYEKTPFVQISEAVVALDKSEEIYNDILPTSGTIAFSKTLDNYDEVWFGVFNTSNGTLFSQKTVPTAYTGRINLGVVIAKSNTTTSSGRSVAFAFDNEGMFNLTVNMFGNSDVRLVVRGIKYTRIKDETTGSVTIDPDIDNAIEQRTDGLFVPKVVDAKVSADADNALEERSDGLYVPKGLSDISNEVGNALIERPDGLYVPEHTHMLAVQKDDLLFEGGISTQGEVLSLIKPLSDYDQVQFIITNNINTILVEKTVPVDSVIGNNVILSYIGVAGTNTTSYNRSIIITPSNTDITLYSFNVYGSGEKILHFIVRGTKFVREDDIKAVVSVDKNELLCEGVVTAGNEYTLSSNIKDYNEVIVIVQKTDNTDGTIHASSVLDVECTEFNADGYYKLFMSVPRGTDPITLNAIGVRIYPNKVYIETAQGSGWSIGTDFTIKIFGIKYTKSTGGASTEVEISKESGNSLVKKDDGLYVPESDASVSVEKGNALVKKTDGLFVPEAVTSVSKSTGNIAELKTDGLYVPEATISTEARNELEKKTDGLYVNNDDLRRRINQLCSAKYTTEQADYFYVTSKRNGPSVKTPVTANTNIINTFTDRITNMDADIDGYVKLLAGKTYKITANLTICDGDMTYNIVDKNGTIIGNEGWASPSSSSKSSTSAAIAVIEPLADTWVGVYVKADGNFYTNYSSILIEELSRIRGIDPVEYLVKEQEIEDTPVGNIISYMGSIAPAHYLICDGAEYPIINYPQLAEHFRVQFGSTNHFGGDGVDTFCVPDLRNEFIRGYHGDATEQLSGEIGEHQDATGHPSVSLNSGGTAIDVIYSSSATELHRESNPDTTSKVSDMTYRSASTSTWPSDANAVYDYTARPTNTTVQFCIKYEKTPFAQLNHGALAVTKDDELFRGTITNGASYDFKYSLSAYDDIWIGVHTPYNDDPYGALLSVFSVPTVNITQGEMVLLDFTGVNGNNTVAGNRRIRLTLETDKLIATSLNNYSNGAVNVVVRGMKYIRLPDDYSGSGTGIISAAAGNLLTKKDDGLYIGKSSPDISTATGNTVEQKADGLYVPGETTYTDQEVEDAIMEIFYPSITSIPSRAATASVTTRTAYMTAETYTDTEVQDVVTQILNDEIKVTLDEEGNIEDWESASESLKSAKKASALSTGSSAVEVENTAEILTELDSMVVKSASNALSSMMVGSPNNALATFMKGSPDGTYSSVSRVELSADEEEDPTETE
ncbi:MAG: phage tail protein [Lachnospiraceae bacterium]|nr:phage tail protein [Lachnospiraceae bacterium]